MQKSLACFAAFAVSFAALAGCATDATSDEPETEASETPAAPLPKVEDGTVAPDQINLTGPCTVSTSCSGAYCCTTTDCRFTTTVECKPRYVRASY